MNKTMEVVRSIKTEASDLPTNLKKARMKDGRSVQVLATYSGISSAYWYKLENSQVDMVSEEIIRRIEQVLNIDLGINFRTPIAVA